MRLAAPIHALPRDGADHRALSTCWCQPEPSLEDAATRALVYVHRPCSHHSGLPRLGPDGIRCGVCGGIVRPVAAEARA